MGPLQRPDALTGFEPAQRDPIGLSHDPIEPLPGELAPAQCKTEIGPIQQLSPGCRQRRRDARFYEYSLHVLPPSTIYVPQGSRGLDVIVRPSAHADFQYGVVSQPTTQEHIEALFARLIPLEVSNDRFRRHLSPMLDYPGMKSAEVAEVPIEAAARDAKLARKHFRLQSIEALVRERCYGEINPVSCRQSFGHKVAPYSAALTPTMGET